MTDWSMTRTGDFGGSDNFLGHLAGVGTNAIQGFYGGMDFFRDLANYQAENAVRPSYVQANIARNIMNQGVAENQHYRNYIDSSILSRLAGGAELTDWQRRMMGYGFGPQNGYVNNQQSNTQVQGTPVVTQPNATPATQVAQPQQTSTGVFSNDAMQQWQGVPYAFGTNRGIL